MAARPRQSILVAVRDPSARRQLAVRKAARIASACDARLTLFHAFSAPFPLPDPLPSTPEGIVAAVAARRRAELLALARPLRAAGLRVGCEVAWDFPPAQAIVRRVLADRPDLVVAESHRRALVARWFLANADWELIRECPCPVWFVKRERLPRRPLLLASVDPSHAHAKPSGLDDRLLDVATSLARDLDGRVALVHVRDATQLLPPVFLPALPAQAAGGQATAEAAVARLARRHGADDAVRVVRAGIPAEVITATADELGADLLVMGAVSRSGLSQAFIGNTSEAVIDAVDCDVLVVKPRGFRSGVPRSGARLPAGSQGRRRQPGARRAAGTRIVKA